MKRVLIAGEEHREEIAALIVSSYSSSNDFNVVDVDKLRHQCMNPHPDTICLVACGGDQILSVMHGRVCSERSDVISTLPYIAAPAQVPIPSLALFRAATVRAKRKSALNSLLRFHFLQMSLEESVRYMIGSVYLGADRTRTMEAMGYTFQENPEENLVLVRKEQPVCLAILDLDVHASLAESVLRTLIGELQTDYPFIR